LQKSIERSFLYTNECVPYPKQPIKTTHTVNPLAALPAMQVLNNTGQLNTEEKHLDSGFRRNDVSNKPFPVRHTGEACPGLEPGAGAFRHPGALLPGVIEQLPRHFEKSPPGSVTNGNGGKWPAQAPHPQGGRP
jgi:hypothetical protein